MNPDYRGLAEVIKDSTPYNVGAIVDVLGYYPAHYPPYVWKTRSVTYVSGWKESGCGVEIWWKGGQLRPFPHPDNEIATERQTEGPA